MAATDQPFRSQKALDIVFAVSCILMLVSVIWMFVQDYARDWKGDQRKFRDVETAVNERLIPQRPPPPNAAGHKPRAGGAARKKSNHPKSTAEREAPRPSATHERPDTSSRSIKAENNTKMSL